MPSPSAARPGQAAASKAPASRSATGGGLSDAAALARLPEPAEAGEAKALGPSKKPPAGSAAAATPLRRAAAALLPKAAAAPDVESAPTAAAVVREGVVPVHPTKRQHCDSGAAAAAVKRPSAGSTASSSAPVNAPAEAPAAPPVEAGDGGSGLNRGRGAPEDEAAAAPVVEGAASIARHDATGLTSCTDERSPVAAESHAAARAAGDASPGSAAAGTSRACSQAATHPTPAVSPSPAERYLAAVTGDSKGADEGEVDADAGGVGSGGASGPASHRPAPYLSPSPSPFPAAAAPGLPTPIPEPVLPLPGEEEPESQDCPVPLTLAFNLETVRGPEWPTPPVRTGADQAGPQEAPEAEGEATAGPSQAAGASGSSAGAGAGGRLLEPKEEELVVQRLPDVPHPPPLEAAEGGTGPTPFEQLMGGLQVPRLLAQLPTLPLPRLASAEAARAVQRQMRPRAITPPPAAAESALSSAFTPGLLAIQGAVQRLRGEQPAGASAGPLRPPQGLLRSLRGARRSALRVFGPPGHWLDARPVPLELVQGKAPGSANAQPTEAKTVVEAAIRLPRAPPAAKPPTVPVLDDPPLVEGRGPVTEALEQAGGSHGAEPEELELEAAAPTSRVEGTGLAPGASKGTASAVSDHASPRPDDWLETGPRSVAPHDVSYGRRARRGLEPAGGAGLDPAASGGWLGASQGVDGEGSSWEGGGVSIDFLRELFA
ncbi:hypothetical protein HYH03_014808 [Edaphochlamys debaryana]|uniref:Uncharacterized protein n=1 Tax=Edaphochlamys debaryana TaxID=47281 RepID=A0A836BRK0_9CHLO|nr:hypothetical protein HYH03_014808 [Edaphochlamys debaryana]|eukprot:KAG2486506.1 hypothetical protein HYH03_014808 [Edaphochlamys debaryana]